MKLDLTKLPVLEMIVGFLLLALAVTFIGAFAATEGSGGEDGDAASETPSDGQTPGGTPSTGDIAVTMQDNSFDPGGLIVATGDSVTFQITNDGRATHNMRIAGADGAYDTDDDGVSDPAAMRGGDTGTLAFTAPDSPGDIDFQCDFHPTEMTGTITVQ